MKVFLLLILFGIPFHSNGQKRNTPFSTTNNFISRRIGIAYPFFNEGDKDFDVSHQKISYGVNAGFEFGHFFKPKFSVSLSVLLMYLKFSDTDLHFEYHDYYTGILTDEFKGNFHYSNFGVLIPIDFNFEIDDKLIFTLGFFIQKPFMDRQYSTLAATEYYHRLTNGHYVQNSPPKVYSPYERVYKNWRSDARAGIHLQYSFLLKSKDWEQKRLNIEYYHSVVKADFELYEQMVVLTYRKVMFQ